MPASQWNRSSSGGSKLSVMRDGGLRPAPDSTLGQGANLFALCRKRRSLRNGRRFLSFRPSCIAELSIHSDQDALTPEVRRLLKQVVVGVHVRFPIQMLGYLPERRDRKRPLIARKDSR